MPHFDRETGDAVQILRMDDETVFKLDGEEHTLSTFDFNARFRAGEPYEISAGKFDTPAPAAPKAKAAAKPAARRKPKTARAAKAAAPAPKPAVTVTSLDTPRAETIT